MAMQVQKSLLVQTLGEKFLKAHEEHKGETTTSGRAEMPPGVNGIAQLTTCRFERIKDGPDKGKLRFYGKGVCVSPSHHEGLPIEGLPTQKFEIIADTPGLTRKTISEHVDF